MRSPVARIVEKWLIVARSRAEHGLSVLPREQAEARDALLDVWRAIDPPLKLLAAGRRLGDLMDLPDDGPTVDLTAARDPRRR